MTTAIQHEFSFDEEDGSERREVGSRPCQGSPTESPSVQGMTGSRPCLMGCHELTGAHRLCGEAASSPSDLDEVDIALREMVAVADNWEAFMAAGERVVEAVERWWRQP